MAIMRETDEEIDKKLEKADLKDFDLDSAMFINEKWNLEKSYPLNIRLNRGILAEAKSIAKEKGVPYQTLIKMYIADGVKRELKLMSV